MAELFGFEIKRKSESDSNAKEVSFAAPQQDDGALQVSATGGAYGTYVDLEGTAKNEAELVTRYRKMGMQPECEHAIDDIVNETIVSDPTEKVVDINLDNVKITANVKKAIMAEFENITSLLNINKLGYEIFRKWYVDGRLYFHAIIDENAPEHGIKELRYVDPRKIRKVREVKKQSESRC